MPDQNVEKKHSQTALMAAIYRASANKEYNNGKLGPDFLAQFFIPPHVRFFIKFQFIRTRGIKKSDRRTPGIWEYMLARTAFFDDVFQDALKKKIPQIVLLGAGYDTRAYRYANLNTDSQIIELDIATTQQRKIRCLKKEKIDIPDQVTYAPINFNTQSLLTVLQSTGYDRQKPSVFLWEGVTYYLEPDAIDATFKLIGQSAHPQSCIAFDYAVSVTKENIETLYGLKKFTEIWKKYRKQEPFKFSIDEGKIELFLEKRGLKLLKHLDNRQIENKYLLDATGALPGQV
ncbi:MAG: SAM-dependent methyltransferase, partial [Desulfobacteraceae bacterium]|nr:SAM-dependent methyltransferase [Desulfobacteraceae bacterium]